MPNLPRDVFLERSISALKNARPEFSAERTFTRGQGAVLLSLPLLAIALFFVWPAAIGAIAAISCALAYIANGVFRALLVWVGAGEAPKPAPPVKKLPLYTILVPLYREANVLPQLVSALRALDYPKKKLDIKLILEEDDVETIAAAEAMALEKGFEIIRVPACEPRTKPKACNYALNFARGEFLVIFDAEDRPEPDQLKKAVAAFRATPAEIACLQARLNFFNAEENFLTAGIMAQTPQAIWRGAAYLGV